MEPTFVFICGCLAGFSCASSKDDKCCPCCGETEKTDYFAEIGKMVAKSAIADVGMGDKDGWTDKCEWFDDKDER